MDIEGLAVSAIENLISKSNYLVANINLKDKLPSWDGEIQIYVKPGDTHRKEDLFWTVPIQVKGKKDSKKFGKKQIKYSVEIADMKNYWQKGGTMFFVVYCDDARDKTKIYYKKFLPYDLKKEIKQHGNQKTRTIIFEEFPEDINEVTDILVAFAQDMKKQRAAIDIDDEKIVSALKNGENIGEISFSWPAISKENNPLDYIFDHGFYLYIDYKDSGVKYPIGYVDHVERIGQKQKCSVTVEKQLFYEQIVVDYLKDRKEIHIGKSITITEFLEATETTCKFSFSLTGMLKERINTIKFLLAVIQVGQFEIDENIYALNNGNSDFPENLSMLALEQYLRSLLEMQETLNALNVSQDLNCDMMTDIDCANMQALKKAIINEESIPLTLSGSKHGFYCVANLHILVLALEKQEGKYKLHDFFDNRVTMKVELEDGNQYKIAPCIFLLKDDLLKCSNLSKEKITMSIENVPLSSVYSSQLTQFLLELLKAYDESSCLRTDLLDIALELSDWIVKNDDICPKEISLINYYQAVKRRRELNDEEITNLMGMIENHLENESYYVGIYLLLNNSKAASIHFNRMSANEQEAFRQYPIYHLAKTTF